MADSAPGTCFTDSSDLHHPMNHAEPHEGQKSGRAITITLAALMLTAGVLAGCADEGGSESGEQAEPSDQQAMAGDFPEPLPVEPLLQKTVLPVSYPDHYMLVGEWYGKRVMIVDLMREEFPVLGSIGLGTIGTIAQTGEAILGASTHFSRTYYGTRTDVVTFFDRATLKPQDEIILPQSKRGLFVEVRGMMEPIDNDQLLLVFNFTPAQSVSVIDLAAREILSEIPIPGCSLIYPLAGRGFATLCGNGTMASYSIGENGEPLSETVSVTFNDVENDPMSAKYGRIGDVAYFPTWGGNVQPIDLSGDIAAPLETWPLVSDAEREAGWRPAGTELVTARPDGQLYVLMRRDASDGSHEKPASEVWGFDVATQERISRWALESPAMFIAATQGDAALIAVGNINSEIDVYDPDGNHQRTLSLGFHPSITWLHPVEAD